jgi:hypothetical protein
MTKKSERRIQESSIDDDKHSESEQRSGSINYDELTTRFDRHMYRSVSIWIGFEKFIKFKTISGICV